MASPAKARPERPTPKQARAIPELVTPNQARASTGTGDGESGAGSEAGSAGGAQTADGSGTGEQNGAGAGSADQKGGGNGTTGDGTGDGELDKALKDFDGTILAERGAIVARANEGAGTVEDPGNGGGGAGGTSSSGGGKGGSQSGGGGNGSQSRGNGGSSTSGNGGGVPDGPAMPSGSGIPAPPMPSQKNAEVASMPSDVADSRDDDVVARQLREAAMDETDPALKEKLWEEYRRYKAGK